MKFGTMPRPSRLLLFLYKLPITNIRITMRKVFSELKEYGIVCPC